MLLRPGSLVSLAVLLALAGCGDASHEKRNPPLNVRVQKVAPQTVERAVTLTGAVRARVQADLSFRVSGRVIERAGEIGQHVEADAILARIDPTEQQADLAAAQAGLTGAEATLRQAAATFERQKALLANGYTTQAAYERADQAQRAAVGSLDAARAQVAAAQDALSYTYLRAGHAGVITARNIEQGQVAQAAQTAFGLAEDGPRDAVFAVYESLLSHAAHKEPFALSLVGDPRVATFGKVREISPVVDEKTGTVQVKVEIDPAAPPMPLGAAISARGHERLDNVIVLPWTALSQKDGAPAVWVYDPATRAVALRVVGIAGYEEQRLILSDGLKAGESVVTEGGKFLRDGQVVTAEERAPS